MPDKQEATLADVVKALEDLQDSLRQVARWVRFQNVPRLRETLVKELNTPQKKVAFELTDGDHSRRGIADEIGADEGTVRSWWDKWFQLAVVAESEARKGRPQKIVSLSELGLEVQKLKPRQEEQPPKPATAPDPDPNNAGGTQP